MNVLRESDGLLQCQEFSQLFRNALVLIVKVWCMRGEYLKVIVSSCIAWVVADTGDRQGHHDSKGAGSLAVTATPLNLSTLFAPPDAVTGNQLAQRPFKKWI